MAILETPACGGRALTAYIKETLLRITLSLVRRVGAWALSLVAGGAAVEVREILFFPDPKGATE